MNGRWRSGERQHAHPGHLMIRASLRDQSIHPSGEILSGQLFFVLKVPHKIRALFVKHMRISRDLGYGEHFLISEACTDHILVPALQCPTAV